MNVRVEARCGEVTRTYPTSAACGLVRSPVAKFRDGKMVERWGSSDQLGMLQQLGVTQLPAG